MKTQEQRSDTPLYDELMAARMPAAAERIVDLPQTSSVLGSQALQETQAVPVSRQVEAKPGREKVLLSPEGYSAGAKSVIDTINNAVSQGDRAIMGKLFLTYVDEHRTYITAHEFTKLREEVRAL